MNKAFKLTQSGIDELQAELDDLIAQRPEITERIKTAREMGDLSENAEYASARSEQDRCELRIKEIEHIIKNAEIIKQPKSANKVHLGSKVVLKSDGGKTQQYQIVGTVEANPLEGKISDESPIGLALMNKTVGDSVEIVTPAQTTLYKVTDIS
ncbi:MAG TPA: transcription elongation factor GreA [Candidatus Saccharibacteria bacterium]|nr:transcription elongation factor GreA [Candidatus Saccharibacteria bacterium]MCB9816943.1 transcription elongation factor GreA [Candidatus Nomurabacteria bacterium]HPD98819.1 transcription elongation factor GreA [Candidatus Saccharibacteria bacterium]HPR10040.1 transcription elongation factor GreA [Candidatus Saccharibacteria bacterium]